MHIAFFTDSYDSHQNYTDGVAVIAQRYASYADQKGISLTIYTNGGEDRNEKVGETVNVKRFKPIIPWYLPFYNELLLDLLVPNPKLIADFEKNHFDIIHFTQPSTMGINAIYASGRQLMRFPFTVPFLIIGTDINILHKRQLPKLPLVGSFHTNIPAFTKARTGSDFFSCRVAEMCNNFYKNCDIILATSQCTQDEIRQYINGKSFGLFRSGVDTVAFNPQKRDENLRKKFGDKVILFFAGRVTPEKNIQLLKKAFIELHKKHRNIHLFIAGDGSMRRSLKEELGDDVSVPGFLHGEELYRAFASSDIFVFPSVTDTLGLVVLEAQASGLPVVVMDQGGPKEVMEHEKTGFLCKADVFEDFVNNIETLIVNEELRKQMGKSARVLAERYSWDRAFDDLIKTYERVIENVYTI
ncbi:MAG: glycosyltransferase family 4 protein [Candidatus Poribacteria bacterium]